MFFMRRLFVGAFFNCTKTGDKNENRHKKKTRKNGRLVIPKELREFYHLEDDKDVEIVATPEGVLITNPNYKMVKKD